MWFGAPWGKSLLVSTLFLIVPMLLLSLYLSRSREILWVVPLAMLIVPMPFMVRGYGILGDQLQIKRFGWVSEVPLTELESVQVEPDAMRQSFRIFGVGGAYSYSGRFRNGTLGRYRAFVTDNARTVVLRFPTDTVVVSPDRPEEFAATLQSRAPLQPVR